MKPPWVIFTTPKIYKSFEGYHPKAQRRVPLPQDARAPDNCFHTSGDHWPLVQFRYKLINE